MGARVPSCQFAVFRPDNGACTTFDTCDDTKVDPGKTFNVWTKTKPEDTATDEVEPVQVPATPGQTEEPPKPKACEPICENAKKVPWERKCTWTETCDGCPICPTVCLQWCTDHKLTWETKG